jgi:hypothetical protein
MVDHIMHDKQHTPQQNTTEHNTRPLLGHQCIPEAEHSTATTLPLSLSQEDSYNHCTSWGDVWNSRIQVPQKLYPFSHKIDMLAASE